MPKSEETADFNLILEE